MKRNPSLSLLQLFIIVYNAETMMMMMMAMMIRKVIVSFASISANTKLLKLIECYRSCAQHRYKCIEAY